MLRYTTRRATLATRLQSLDTQTALKLSAFAKYLGLGAFVGILSSIGHCLYVCESISNDADARHIRISCISDEVEQVERDVYALSLRDYYERQKKGKVALK